MSTQKKDSSVKSGDKLEVVWPFHTRGTLRHFGRSKRYEKGHIIEVLEPTGHDPWGYDDPGGRWVVKCPYFSPPQNESIWDHTYGLAMLLHKGWLRKVS